MSKIGPGDRLGSNYVLGAVLGRGSMGVVHEACSNSIAERFAVKVLHPHLADDVSIVGRFVQERQVLECIDHANVVRVRDLVVDAGHVGIVMEHVEGVDLRDLLIKRSITALEAVEIGEQLADGLRTIHSSGIIHRDLKPGNVLITSGPARLPKITDFGISQLADGDDLVEAFAGTPRYVAPEALTQGNPVGPAFDVYTLGLVLFEMLTGTPPFLVEGTLACMLAHRDQVPPRVGGVPLALTELIDQMLAKRPDERPDADEVCAKLGALVLMIDPEERPSRVEAKARPASPPAATTSAEPVATPEPPRAEPTNPAPTAIPHQPSNVGVYRTDDDVKPVTAFVAAVHREAERRRRKAIRDLEATPTDPPLRLRRSTFAELARREAARRQVEGPRPTPSSIAADDRDEADPAA